MTDTPCEHGFSANCANANLLTSKEHDYTLGFVEIDDQGQRQVDTLILERGPKHFHRLQTLPPATQAKVCAANPGWLTSAMQQQKQTQLNTGLVATGAR